MCIVACGYKRTLKQLEREQIHTHTDRHTHTQDKYSNPRACAPRVKKDASLIHTWHIDYRGSSTHTVPIRIVHTTYIYLEVDEDGDDECSCLA